MTSKESERYKSLDILGPDTKKLTCTVQPQTTIVGDMDMSHESLGLPLLDTTRLQDACGNWKFDNKMQEHKHGPYIF